MSGEQAKADAEAGKTDGVKDDGQLLLDALDKLGAIRDLVREGMGFRPDEAKEGVKALVAEVKRLRGEREGKADDALAAALAKLRENASALDVSYDDCEKSSDAEIVEKVLRYAHDKWRAHGRFLRTDELLDQAGVPMRYTDGMSDLPYRTSLLIAECDRLRAELSQIGLVIAREKIKESGR